MEFIGVALWVLQPCMAVTWALAGYDPCVMKWWVIVPTLGFSRWKWEMWSKVRRGTCLLGRGWVERDRIRSRWWTNQVIFWALKCWGVGRCFFPFFGSDVMEDAEIKCPKQEDWLRCAWFDFKCARKGDICEAQGVHHVTTAQPTKETLRVCRLSCHFQFFRLGRGRQASGFGDRRGVPLLLQHGTLGFGGVAVGWQGNGHVLLKISTHPRIVASHQPSWFTKDASCWTHGQFPKPDESWETCAGSIQYFGPTCIRKTIQQLRNNMLTCWSFFGECFSQSADSPISRWFFDPCFLGRPFCGMNLTPPSPFDSTRYLCNSFRIHISLSESGAKTKNNFTAHASMPVWSIQEVFWQNG